MPEMRHKSKDYAEFVGKFKEKKTTDDCYTPPEVYDAVLDFVRTWLPESIEGKRIARPFYPGGDYEHEDYTGAVVIDNPPFSIISKIVKFYNERQIPYFLFAPLLTLFSIPAPGFVVQHQATTYTNGATVATGFVTNMFHGVWGIKAMYVPPDKSLPKTAIPAGYESAATLRKYCRELKPGQIKCWAIEGPKISKNEEGHGIFGYAYPLKGGEIHERRTGD